MWAHYVKKNKKNQAGDTQKTRVLLAQKAVGGGKRERCNHLGRDKEDQKESS